MTDAVSEGDRDRKERSPSFPFISLGRAIDRARLMAAAHRRSPTRQATVGETWGYGPKSSGLTQTVAALKAFGLIDDIGRGEDRRIQLSDLAWRILHDARAGAKEQAIREAACRPKLIAEYVQHWVPERPSDNHCVSELHLDRGFTQDSARTFLKVFDETVRFARLGNSDSLSDSLDGETHEPEDMGRKEDALPTRKEEMQASIASIAVGRVGTKPPPPASHALPPLGEPYRLSLTKRGIEISGFVSDVETADELIAALNAWKLLLASPTRVVRPSGGSEEEHKIDGEDG